VKSVKSVSILLHRVDQATIFYHLVFNMCGGIVFLLLSFVGVAKALN